MSDGFKPVKIETVEGAQMAFDTLRSAIGMLTMFDWEALRQNTNMTHSVGHILDPTAYKAYIYNPQTSINEKIVSEVAGFLARIEGLALESKTLADAERLRQGAGG